MYNFQKYDHNIGTKINQKQQNINLILKRVKSRIRFVYQKMICEVTSVIGHIFSENKNKDRVDYYFESNSFFTLF
jgi:hypothetical protein